MGTRALAATPKSLTLHLCQDIRVPEKEVILLFQCHFRAAKLWQENLIPDRHSRRDQIAALGR